MKKYICFFAVALCTVNNTNGQLLKKLGEKVKSKTEQKAENKVDQKIDKTIDDAMKGELPAASKETAPAAEPTGGEKTKSPAAASSSQDSKFAYKSKFDFVPGENVLIWEDFTADAVGDFPAKWFTNGSGEVVTIDEMEGKWLMLKASSEYFIDQLLKLPDNFTIQFDLLCSTPFNWSSSRIDFKLSDIKDITRYQKGQNGGENSENNFNHTSFSFDLHPGVVNEANYNSKGYGHYRFGTIGANINLEEIFMPVSGKNLLKVSFWRQKQRIRIYVNENKIVDLPKILTTDMNPNLFTIYSERFEPNDNYFISNLRIAVGNPDTRNKLITQGKFITNGILFDVNSDKIKPESFGVLKEIASILKESAADKYKIWGHTDSDGDAAKNLDLSKRRASAIKQALINDFKIEADRLETDGKGEAEPLNANDSPQNKANNRRVEFVKK